MQSESGNNPTVTSFPDVVIGILGFIKFLLSKWYMILLFGVLGAGAGFAFAWFSKPYYIAKTTLTIESGKSTGAMSGALDLAQQFGLIGGGSNAPDEEKVVEILKSRRMFATALLNEAEINGRKDLLANHYIEEIELDKKLKKIPGMENFRFHSKNIDKLDFRQDSVMNVMYQTLYKNNFSIGKDLKSRVITVTIRTHNELFSKYFCEQLIDALSNFYLSKKNQKNLENYTLMQQRCDSVATVLHDAENKLARIKDNSNRVIKAQGYLEQMRTQREVQILSIMYAEVIKNVEISKFNMVMNTPLIQLIDYPVLPLETERTRKLFSALFGALALIFLYVSWLTLSSAVQKKIEEDKQAA